MDRRIPPPRKPYRAPRLRRVRLEVEEAVLAACKNPGWGACQPPKARPTNRLGS